MATERRIRDADFPICFDEVRPFFCTLGLIFNDKRVSAHGLCFTYCACGKFDHRVCGEAEGKPPRMHLASCLHDPMFPVEIDKVNGELHPERVDGFAWNDPQAFPIVQLLAAKQAPAAIASITRELNTVSKAGSAGEVGYANQHFITLGAFSLSASLDVT
jgi:hypothetical protein